MPSEKYFVDDKILAVFPPFLLVPTLITGLHCLQPQFESVLSSSTRAPTGKKSSVTKHFVEHGSFTRR